MSSNSSLAPLLKLSGASKSYPLRAQPLKQLLLRILGRVDLEKNVRTALQSISFEVQRGQSIGIIGLNGAGKSTLLQLASGVVQPSAGSVALSGTVAALLELGAGFNPDASGRENIFLYAATLGLPRARVQSLYDEIVAFSGLESFIDAPVKTYSSGMQVRLAFAVATSIQPDLLIVDEALSVGDGIFAKRSFDRIMELRKRGTALLLSSHALFHIDQFCERTLWLHQGAVRAWGDTRTVLPQYQEFLDAFNSGGGEASGLAIARGDTSVPEVGESKIQGLEPPLHSVTIEGLPPQLISARIEVDGVHSAELPAVSLSSAMRVIFEIRPSSAEPYPRAAVVISSDSGLILGSALSPVDESQLQKNGTRLVEFALADLPLNKGRYRVGVYLMCARGQFVYAWSDPHAHLEVKHNGPHQGAWILQGTWK